MKLRMITEIKEIIGRNFQAYEEFQYEEYFVKDLFEILDLFYEVREKHAMDP